MQILDDYFGIMIACIYEYGGDIIKFCGDAVICTFAVASHHPPNAAWDDSAEDYEAYVDGYVSEEEERRLPESFEEVVARAVQCSLQLQRSLADFRTPTGDSLFLHVTMGCGEWLAMTIGGNQVSNFEPEPEC